VGELTKEEMGEQDIVGEVDGLDAEDETGGMVLGEGS
jgi:hypothetical protein